MASRMSRIGRNEALFRQVNEQVRALVNEAPKDPTDMQIICECGGLDCTDQIGIRVSEYEELRRDSDLFAIVPGHSDELVERVVEQREQYEVVRKHAGPATLIAEVTDPRGS